MKTIEELTAELEEQRANNEAMNAKNKQLLDEMKRVKKQNSEVDLDAYHKALDRVDSLESENAKLNGDVKLKAKDLEKLTTQLGEKEGALTKLVIDDGLNNALISANVKKELLPAVKALLRGQAQLVGDKAMVGDKALADFMTEWASTEGKAYIEAPQNSGGGASGGNNGTGGKDIDTSKMTPNEMMRMGRNQTN